MPPNTRCAIPDAVEKTARFTFPEYESYDGSLKAGGIELKLQELVARANLPAATNLPGMLERAVERVFSFIPFTPLANFTGQPSMSVPLWHNRAGLPVGSMFTAPFGDEAVLFRLAAQLEQARPWADKRPPTPIV